MYDQFMAYLVAADAALCSAGTVNVPLHHNQVGAVTRGKRQSLLDVIPTFSLGPP